MKGESRCGENLSDGVMNYSRGATTVPEKGRHFRCPGMKGPHLNYMYTGDGLREMGWSLQETRWKEV